MVRRLHWHLSLLHVASLLRPLVDRQPHAYDLSASPPTRDRSSSSPKAPSRIIDDMGEYDDDSYYEGKSLHLLHIVVVRTRDAFLSMEADMIVVGEVFNKDRTAGILIRIHEVCLFPQICFLL